METLNLRRIALYEWGIGIAGLLVGVVYLHQLQSQNLLLILLLFSLAILLELVPVPLGKVDSSLLVSLLIGVLICYGTAEAIWMMFVAGFVALSVTRKTSLNIIVFNSGQYAVSAWLMTLVYQVAPTTTLRMDWSTVVAVILCGVTFLISNHILIHIHDFLRNRFDRRDILSIFLADGLNVVVALPFSILMIAIGPNHPYLAPVVMLPIVLLSQVMRISKRMAFMQQVNRATIKLTSEFDVDRIAENVAQVTHRLTYADVSIVFTMDSTQTVLVPSAIYPPSAASDFRMLGYHESEGGVIWNTIRNNHSEYVPDTRKDPRVRDDGAGRSEYRTMGIFPMHFRGTIQGAIVCYCHRAYALGEKNDYVEALSRQAAILLDNARLYHSLQEQSRLDGATGLFNYRFFYEGLSQRVQLAEQSHQPLSVAIVDVDYFKKFNDTWGHLAGDEVLRSVGQLMRELAGPSALVARYGGEEFGIIVPYDSARTMQLVEEIRAAVAHHVVDFDGYRLQGITVSCGIASYPEHSTNDRDLLLKADSAMYWGAKQRGRNKVALYSPEFEAQLFVDGLTGLYTYHFANIRIREEFSRGIHRWAAVCVDLERFSYVNNSFGFAVGDKVLQETSQLIKECLRHTEVACRYGGDEFLILIPNVNDDEAKIVASRVEKAIASHRYRSMSNIYLSVRCRVNTIVCEDLQDTADLFERVGIAFANLNQSSGESLA